MGRDKALLPHPEGGCWLERALRLLASLQLPLTLLSRHPEHLARARALPLPRLETMAEPPPWEGPLRAVERLMAAYPGQRLLLCPVDMPALSSATLHQLQAVASADPTVIHLAQGREHLQPLLAVLPASPTLHQHLQITLDGGERRLQRWLQQHPWRPVPLAASCLRNCNRPEDLQPGDTASA
jgi:molybdopterin-guanine dinucleotide biosynthesis protein A